MEETDHETAPDRAPKKYWPFLKTVFKLLVAAGALYWVSRQVDLGEVGSALLGSDFLFLALAFLFYVCSQVIASSRLNGHFQAIGLQLTERYNFRLFLLGLFYNLFLPGGIGGDGYKLYFLR